MNRSIRYSVRCRDRVAEVRVEATGDGSTYRVEIDGVVRTLEWVDVPGRRVVTVLADGVRQCEVVAHRRGPETYSLLMQGQPFELECVEALVAEARAASHVEAADQGCQIRAPIPGKIVRILKAVGDEVTTGDPVVILEAMKMQNELRALGSGRIERILVAEGQAVDGNTLLVAIGAGA